MPTRRDDAERRLQIQYDVSAALAESETIEEGGRRALAGFAQHMRWPLGVLWIPDEADATLHAIAIHGVQAVHPDFVEAIRATRFAKGEGLPGRVWRTAETVSAADVAELEAFPRMAVARRAGLHGAFAFPGCVGSRVAAVLEFFTTTSERPGEAVSRAARSVGQQIGQFVDRKRAVAAALAATARNAALIETSLDAIVIMGGDGIVVDWSPAAERTFGWTRAAAVGRALTDLIVPPSLQAAHTAGLARHLATGEARVLGRRIETVGRRRDGSELPVELAITRLPVPGAPLFAGYLRDLSAAKRMLDEQRLLVDAGALLAESLDYEHTLRNLSRIVVPEFADWYAVDLAADDGGVRRLEIEHRDPARVRFAQELAARYPAPADDEHGAGAVIRTGRPEWVAEISDEILRARARDPEHERLLRTLGLHSYIIVPLRAQGRVRGAITFVLAESGRRYDERSLAFAEELARRAGQAIDNALLYREVAEAREQLEQQATELEAQAEELEETASELEAANLELREAVDALAGRTREAEAARQEADEANRAKSDFLAAMSHELRTPLNAIVGYTQLLDVGVRGPVSEVQHEDLQRIQRASKHLLGLINDILNFAKLESGQLSYRMRPIEVAEVLTNVEDLIGPQAREKQLAYGFENRCPGVLACADREKLTQIFVNLLSNAVRFTEPGGRIGVICEAVGGEVVTRVSDTGIGIPSDQHEAIFEPFVQVGRQYPGERQGTGLGLAISRELARAMGGDLTVESEPGKGSTFTVTVPVDRT